MSKKRTRGISYYLNFSLKSIQGRITLGFLITTLYSVLLVIIGNSFWSSIIQEKDHLLNDIKPLNLHSINLLNKIKETETNLNQFLYLNDLSYKNANQQLWIIDIPARKDSLLHYINRSENQDANNIYSNVVQELGKLRQLQQQVETTHTTSPNSSRIKNLIKKDHKLSLQEIERLIRKIIRASTLQEKALQRTLELRQNRFYLVAGVAFPIGFILCYVVGIWLLLGIFRWIRKIRKVLYEISQGHLSQSIEIEGKELKGITSAVNDILTNLHSVRNYAIEIGKGNFVQDTSMFGEESELGQSLTEMGNSLQSVSEEERKRNWATEGLAQFAEILRNNSNDLEKLCQEIVRNLVSYLNVSQGGIFLIDQDLELFELKSTYAYNRHKYLQRHIPLDEGLIGRVYQEKEVVYLEDVPEDYLLITSGFGEIVPKNLILLPLQNDEGEINGVVELAGLEKLENYQIQFLERVCNSIASTITVVMASQKNNLLLKDSQRIAESLKVKEEEARKNAEDLHQAREELARELRHSQEENQKLSAILDSTLEAIIIFNEKDEIEVFNRSAEKLFGYQEIEVSGKSIALLFEQGQQSLRESLGTRNHINLERKALNKAGHILPVEISLTAFSTDESTGFTAVISS